MTSDQQIYRRTGIRLALGMLMASFAAGELTSQEADAKRLVEQVVSAAGGEPNLLQLFRFRERVLISSTVAAPVTATEKGNRTSVIELPNNWWIGTAKRDKDKTRVLVWAWSLRILLDPKSKITAIEATTVNGQPAFGLRVSESIKEPLDLFFNKTDNRLSCIDYTDTRHIFSDWKKTDAGHHYPTHVVGFRFANRDAKTLQEKQWYQTDILELTPLSELPPELKK